MSQQDLVDAAREGDERQIRALLRRGVVDIHKKNAHKQTALALAAKHGHRDIVRLLIDADADIDASDWKGRTVLNLAIKHQRNQVVRLLLSKGANKELTDKNGMAPLHWAAKVGDVILVQLLVNDGANTTAIDDEGHTAFTLAKIGGHQAVMELLGGEESSNSSSEFDFVDVDDDEEATFSAPDDEEEDHPSQKESPQQSTSSIPAEDDKKPEIPVKVLKAHTESIIDLVFSPDGRLFASASSDKSVKLWDPNTGDLLHTFRLVCPPKSLSFSPDNSLLAAGSEAKVTIWGSSTRSLARIIPSRMISGTTVGMNEVSFSPDGRFLASGGGSFTLGSDREILGLCNPDTGDLVRTIALQYSALRSLTFSPDGLLYTIWDDKVVSFDPNTGDEVRHFQTNCADYRPTRIPFTRDGGRFASGIDVWDTNAGVIVRSVNFDDDCPCITQRTTGFSPDGRTFALTGETKDGESCVYFWDANTGKHVDTFRGPNRYWAAVFSPNGRLLAIGMIVGEDYVVEIRAIPDRILTGN